MCYIRVISLILLVLFGIQTAVANGGSGRAVVGIDYGTTNVRMGMLRSGVGSVEIVLSFESDRKTINAVAYRDESVLFSQTAMNMVAFILIQDITYPFYFYSSQNSQRQSSVV